MKFRLHPLTLSLGAALAGQAFAQEAAPEQQLEAVTVTSRRSPLDPDLPANVASRTADELREQQNLFNPEDALRNLPNTVVRKRYSGDRNALIGGRSFATSQAPRGLVLMDGYLLSNFLGRFDAPRWNMLAPEEMDRIDVFQGPFSALYPGNSIGTTVAITTTRPKGFEASGRLAMQSQRHGEYGLKDTYDNNQASVLLGNRLDSGLWYRLMLNRQDSTSQPMQYHAVNGPFTAGTGGTAVTGVVYDTGPNGQPRAVFGASGGAIDHTLQHTAKATFGYDFSPGVSADGFIAWWHNDTRTRNATFLRDAAGNPVWSGTVNNAGNQFTLGPTVFAPYQREETHLQTGLTLKTRHATGWNGSIVVSDYRQLQDTQRTAANPDPVAAQGGPGTATARDGTGFRTLELQGTYTPVEGDWTGGSHTLAAGLHASGYRLRQTVAALGNPWQSAPFGTEGQFVGGRTRLFALYAQDAWRFAPQWKATTGLRWESWRSSDGVQRLASSTQAAPGYAEREASAFSPKLSLSWDARPDLTLRASAGRGVRFPTVAELFQGTVAGNEIAVSDPNLKPERSDALELSAEKRFDHATLRASVFQDDVRNTIWSQREVSASTATTVTRNVGRVRTRGLELATQVDRLGLRGLSADASIAFNRSTIVENDLPATVGRHWVRIPRVRSATTLSYAATDAVNLAATYRYSGRQYNTDDNVDVHPDVYGGVSRLKQLDLRVLYRFSKQTDVAVGVDNATGNRAYQSHPFPGRSLFAEVRHGL